MGDRHLFIGNLCSISLDTLRSYCEKYGSITSLSIARDNDNNIYHCFAFLTFQTVRSANQFMSKRPHLIHGEEIFVKRSLSRTVASIPERLVVTNRLVLPDAAKFEKKSVKHYFEKLGHIRHFDYDNGIIDYDDYDTVDRILLARPHRIHRKEIHVTKVIPSEPADVDERVARLTSSPEDETIKVKYEQLQRQFDEYKQSKETELNHLRKELEQVREALSDVTQIKLDKLIKNQQLFHNQLVNHLFPNSDTVHAQMCEDFLRAAPSKKRKATETLTGPEYEISS